MVVTHYPQYKTQKELPENYWQEKQREGDYAYVWYFKYQQGESTFYPKVDFDGATLDEIKNESHTLPFDLVKVELFPFDWDNKSGRDAHLKEFSKFRNLLNQYFYNTLSYDPFEKQRKFLDFNFTVLIAPKETVEEIKQTINEYKLTKFNDFIFYLIAIIQKLYVDKIEYYQRKEPQNEIKKFPDEIKKLLRVIEKAGERDWHKELKNINPSRLEKITFYFNNETITIKDGSLLLDIIYGMVRQEDSIIYPHEKEKVLKWKEHTKSLPNLIYSPYQFKDKFKYAVVQALQIFLTEQTTLKPDSERKTSDKQIEFIIKILQFVHIKITHKDGSINDDIASCIDTVREWLKKSNDVTN
jgi:hypothetical protein